MCGTGTAFPASSPAIPIGVEIMTHALHKQAAIRFRIRLATILTHDSKYVDHPRMPHACYHRSLALQLACFEDSPWEDGADVSLHQGVGTLPYDITSTTQVPLSHKEVLTHLFMIPSYEGVKAR